MAEFREAESVHTPTVWSVEPHRWERGCAFRDSPLQARAKYLLLQGKFQLDKQTAIGCVRRSHSAAVHANNALGDG